LANGPFLLSELPISGSILQIGITQYSNNIRVMGGFTYDIDAGVPQTQDKMYFQLSIAHCTLVNTVEKCNADPYHHTYRKDKDAFDDVPVASGAFNFKKNGLCPA
jgi:hypothetical protein